MNDRLEFSKFLAKSLLTEAERKDPDVMFDNGMMCMETKMLASLAKYVKTHSGELQEYQEMLEFLVEDGVIDEESKIGYLGVIKELDLWRTL